MRTIEEFLSYLNSLNVKLWEDKGYLRYKAPPGTFTPELRAELVERKAEVLSFLRQSTELSNYQIIPKRTNRDSAPLLFIQQAIWLLHQLEPNRIDYNVKLAVRLTGVLNVAALQQALDAIVTRHEVLRTNFISENGNPIQVIREPQTVKLMLVDLQDYPPTEREKEVDRRSATAILPNPQQLIPATWTGSVHTYFSQQAQRIPQQLAVVDAQVSWNYAELEERTNLLANYLLEHQIQSQDLVAIYAHRSANLV